MSRYQTSKVPLTKEETIEERIAKVEADTATLKGDVATLKTAKVAAK